MRKYPFNTKPMTDEEIKALVKEVKRQRKAHPEFKPSVGEFRFESKNIG